MAGGHARKRTSLVLTVLDEVGTIDALLTSIAAQTCQPDEVVIVDGGSTDGTVEALGGWFARLPLRVIHARGASISLGRNLAIAAATNDLVAVTDAGVRLQPDWLERLFDQVDDDVDVVSGFFVADPRNTFEEAMSATVLPSIEDVKPSSFLPSSRSVLVRKSAWERVGGYPEWLDYCEDLVFDFALRDAGSRFAFAPRAVARYRPRGSLGAFFRQYYRYARGDGKADLWRRRHAIRYATYVAAPMLLRAGGIWRLLAIVGAMAYVRRPLERLWARQLPVGETLQAAALVPIIRFTGDIAKMLGYPVGVWWRLTRARGDQWNSPSSS